MCSVYAKNQDYKNAETQSIPPYVCCNFIVFRFLCIHSTHHAHRKDKVGWPALANKKANVMFPWPQTSHLAEHLVQAPAHYLHTNSTVISTSINHCLVLYAQTISRITMMYKYVWRGGGGGGWRDDWERWEGEQFEEYMCLFVRLFVCLQCLSLRLLWSSYDDVPSGCDMIKWAC